MSNVASVELHREAWSVEAASDLVADLGGDRDASADIAAMVGDGRAILIGVHERLSDGAVNRAGTVVLKPEPLGGVTDMMILSVGLRGQVNGMTHVLPLLVEFCRGLGCRRVLFQSAHPKMPVVMDRLGWAEHARLYAMELG